MANPTAMTKVDDSAKRIAMYLWAMGVPDKQIRDALRQHGVDVADGTVRKWRERSDPDGEDWRALREQFIGGRKPIKISVIGPRDEIRAHMTHVNRLERLMGIAMASLSHKQLFDSEGNAVKELYTEDGKTVRISGLRPESFKDVIAALRLGKEVTGVFKEIREAFDFEAMQQQMRAEAAAELMNLVNLSPQQHEQLAAAFNEDDPEAVDEDMDLAEGFARCAECGEIISVLPEETEDTLVEPNLLCAKCAGIEAWNEDDEAETETATDDVPRDDNDDLTGIGPADTEDGIPLPS